MKRMAAQERKEVYRLAGAKAMVLHGPAACLRDSLVQPHLPDGERSPLTSSGLTDLHGGVTGCWARVKEGGVLTDGQLAPWTPGFFLGLKLSGALVGRRNRTGREWLTYPLGARPWLERDLASMSPVHGRLLKPRFFSGVGNRVLCRCPAADLPCPDPLGLDVVAGSLAGATGVKEGGERWLKVSIGCSQALEAWGVPYREDEGMDLLVSPFWGALLSPMMPPRLRGAHERAADAHARGGRMSGVGGCPLLPSVMWSMAMTEEFGRWMTSRGELPYGRPWDWWRFGDVPMKASRLPAEGLRMGITRVRPEVRVLMVGWREGALARKSMGAHPLQGGMAGGESTPGGEPAASPLQGSGVEGSAGPGGSEVSPPLSP